MQKDFDLHDVLAPVATNRRRVDMKCRRCSVSFTCLALEVGENIWPVTFYCDPCFNIARAEFDYAEREQYRLKRARAWEDDVGRDAFTDTDPARLDARLMARVMAWNVGPKGLLLHGPSGRGKSRLMYLLARRTYVDDAIPVLVTRATAAARKVSDFNNFVGSTEAYIRQLIGCAVLFIDDLGKETQSERWESALVEIFDARNAARRPCVITTNYVGDKLAERYRDRQNGDAVVRRLREFCTPIGFQTQEGAR
jgi:DNA replication protein DnaC